MKRRDFIKNTALLTAATGLPLSATAANMPNVGTLPAAPADSQPTTRNSKLIDTPPALMNYAETSMGITFGVSALANGFVTYGEKPDLSDGITVKCGGYRVTRLDDKVMQVRLTGLKPATTYYFRISADRIEYKGGYKMKILGKETDDKIYSFTTAGKKAKSHFAVMNDTHANWKSFTPTIEKVCAISPSCVIWNGDALNSDEEMDKLKQVFLNPPIDANSDYASRIPLLLAQGNHELRGWETRTLENIFPFRQPEERSSRDWDLGRNFAVRMGDIAMIGLDTGEDKLDTNPLFCNLFTSGPYREAQTLWLKDVLQRPEIKSAPHLVAFCHIPLFDSDPKENPGDLYPADKHPDYSPDFASWQRTCNQLWSPLLNKAKCQLVITAHTHVYRYDEPGKDRCWAQIVGGGPDLSGKPGRFPTVVEGKVEDGNLVVRVHNIYSGQVEAEHVFAPRKKMK